MFDEDITHDLVIDKLIEDTTNNQTYWWIKRVYTTFTQYEHFHKVDNGIDIIFKIFHYTSNNVYTLTSNLKKNKENKYITLFITNNSRIPELIETIEKSGSFCVT